MAKYRVMIQDDNEVFESIIEADEPRIALEYAINMLGYAYHKFNTNMDLDASNPRRIVYRSKGVGDKVLTSIVKVID